MPDIDTWGRSDLDRVVQVLNAASLYDTFATDHVADAVFSDIDHEGDLLLCVREEGRNGQIVGVAAAVVRTRLVDDAPPIGFLKLFAVAPASQHRGVGAALLEEVERRLRERGAGVVLIFGDAPFYLRPGVDFRLTPLVCFLLRHGFRVRDHAANMRVDLAATRLDTTADEARLHALGFTIRRLAADDAAAFRAYLEREWGWGWATEACRSLERDPISTHLALQGGEIVGFASCNASGPGQFGPMGVRTEVRRHGIGGVLLKRCLADQRAQGYADSDIQWVGPFGFYARYVDAVISRCFWQFQKGGSTR